MTYNGAQQSPKWDNYDANKLQIGGTTSAINAGTYTATFTPKAGYKWSDGTSTAKTVTWTIGRALIPSPTQSGALTYTGQEQQPTWNNYDTGKMTLGGMTRGTNAGSYSAALAPKSNYKFVDADGAKTVAWAINKAVGSLTLDKESVAAVVADETVVATRSGDGVISAVSSNTGVATVSVDGTKIKIKCVSTGSATITVKCAEGTNYTAPKDKTISVSVIMADPVLANNTPDTIQKVSRSGNAANIWNIGDSAPIVVKGYVGTKYLDGTYYAFIVGFDHNPEIEGKNSIHFQFGKDSSGKDIAFVDTKYGTTSSEMTDGFRMNLENKNKVGWAGSHMRGKICQQFLIALPTDWQNVIIPCTKYSDNTGDGSDTADYVTDTHDKIWLLSEFEVFGERKAANSAEQNFQKQYDYYKNGNSVTKYKHNDTSSSCTWWLRSVSVINNTDFTSVYCGRSVGFDANSSEAFAPGFMVA